MSFYLNHGVSCSGQAECSPPNESAHTADLHELTANGSAPRTGWKPLLLFAGGFHDLSEAARIKAGAADEGAVDVGLAHEFAGIFRFHAAAVLNPHSLGCGLIGHFAQDMSNERVRFLCLLGCCVAPGTDCPHRFVRDHALLQIFRL